MLDPHNRLSLPLLISDSTRHRLKKYSVTNIIQQEILNNIHVVIEFSEWIERFGAIYEFY